MAPYTYYFAFSIIAFLSVALFIANLILLRASGHTTFGLAYKPGTPEHERGQKLASNRNITISVIIALALMANLVISAVRLVHLGTQDAHFVLIFMPVALIAFVAYMNYRAVGQFGNSGTLRGNAKTAGKK
jgi:hypothetical protein